MGTGNVVEGNVGSMDDVLEKRKNSRDKGEDIFVCCFFVGKAYEKTEKEKVNLDMVMDISEIRRK